MDFTFHDTDHVYGIPEHADKFSLQDTSNSDPYRLYNLDVFEYELWNPMALYAAIPFMVGIYQFRYINFIYWIFIYLFIRLATTPRGRRASSG